VFFVMTAPKHLSAASRGLWKTILDSYSLTVDELEVLRLALEQLDLAEKARVEIDRDGLTILSRLGGRIAHPAVGIRDHAVSSAARLFKQLGLPPVKESSYRLAPALGRHRAADRVG
jgi:P27 family predicted phage terminase small subunit